MNHQKQLESLIAMALAEDIGSGDVTSELLIPTTATAELKFVAREPVIACGTFIPAEVYAQLSPPPVGGRQGGGHFCKADKLCHHPNPPPTGEGIIVKPLAKEGQKVRKNTVLAVAVGPARALLSGERVALNFMQRLCGVATLTRHYVQAVKGTKAIILDTRKTIPGFRLLDKYAVRTGGGQNHRMGLYDAVLIKDNHIALAGGVNAAIKKARKKNLPVIVECDTLAQVKEALAAKPDRILLDNMSLKELREAVKLVKGKIPLEASGSVSLQTVKAIAKTGVDYISVGKLTHSAPAADIGADIEIKTRS